jgi:antitoxin ParD1/3/4
MNVSLGEYEVLVRARVDSGEYGSASDVVRAGLRLLAEEERLRGEIRARVAEGVAAAKAGKLIDADEAFDSVRKKLTHGRKRRRG